MAETSCITEADILAEVVSPDGGEISPEWAHSILSLRFGDKAVGRMNELAEKNREASLTEAERVEMEKYLRVGNFLNLLRAKARASLRRQGSIP